MRIEEKRYGLVELSSGDLIYVLDKNKKTIETIKITDGMLSNLKGFGDCLRDEVISLSSINYYFFDKKYKATSDILKFPLYTAHMWSDGVGMGQTYGYNFKKSNVYFYIDKESAILALNKLLDKEYKISEINKIVTEAKAEANKAYNEVYCKAIERLRKERGISSIDMFMYNQF